MELLERQFLVFSKTVLLSARRKIPALGLLAEVRFGLAGMGSLRFVHYVVHEAAENFEMSLKC